MRWDYFAILISCRQNNWTLNKQELNDLTELAKQCPLEYGNAVYKARVLLSLFDSNEYTNKCEATASGQTLIKQPRCFVVN
ncbi:MAG: hypothetical protein WC223_04915 [Bacteroidales bacterium]